MRTLLFAAAAMFVTSAAMADLVGDPVASSLPRIVTPDDNGKTFDLKVGQCIDVRLSTQSASTGYEWFLAPGMSEKMSLAARTVTTPGTPAGAPVMVGAPSQLDYILCAAAPGEVAVKFVNFRMWEKNIPPAKTLSFTVKIAK